MKPESPLKTIQLSCKLGEKFEETAADGRDALICNFANGASASNQGRGGKGNTVTRPVEGGESGWKVP